jgi:hypothetical protein
MALQTFDFPTHVTSVSYPKRGAQVKLGGNWTYTTKPNAPAMKSLQLRFDGLWWFKDSNNVLSATIQPKLNLLALENFYAAHELHQEFIYPSDRYGNMIVRFEEPLVIPEAVKNGNGLVKDITIKLIQQPT